MQNFVRRIGIFTLTIASSLAILAQNVSADAGDALPFTPPVAFQRLPQAFVPNPVLSWESTNALSGFAVMNSPVAVPMERFATLLRSQASLTGNVVSSSSAPVCGFPAARVITRVKATGQVNTEQIQSIGGVSYISIYTRPPNEAADPNISGFIAKYCGPKSGSTAPPVGWRAVDAKILGIWMGKSVTQTVLLMSRMPQSDAQKLAAEAAKIVYKGAAVKIVSDTKGTLCGNEAHFFDIKAKIKDLPATEMRMETTQSPAVAYILMYAHAESSPNDPRAIESLATLCANAAPQPLRSSSLSPSAPPTGGPLPQPS